MRQLLTIEANGVNLTYLEQGQGTPVVFVHGGFVDHRSWRFQIDPFSKRYRVIAYNRRYAFPNKRTGDRADDTTQNNAEDLLALLNVLGVSEAHFVSVTTGSVIVLHFALRHPEKVKTLVVADPLLTSLMIRNPNSKLELLSFFLRNPARARSLMKVSGVLKAARAALAAGDPKEAASILVGGLQGNDPRFPRKEAEGPRLFDRIPFWIQEMFVDNTGDLNGGPSPSGEHHFTVDDGRKITAPVLLIKTELWKPLNPITDALSKCLPNNEVVTIKGVGGDYGRWVEPYPFNDVVLGFLAKHP
jgi:non-heme chloroperoxidase